MEKETDSLEYLLDVYQQDWWMMVTFQIPTTMIELMVLTQHQINSMVLQIRHLSMYPFVKDSVDDQEKWFQKQ